jgi:putative DNA primase/helicase
VTAASVKIIRFNELPKGSDVSDFFDAEGTREQLLDRIAAEKPITAATADDFMKLEGMRELSVSDVLVEIAAIDFTRPFEEQLRDLDELSKIVPPMTVLERAMLREQVAQLLRSRDIKSPARIADAVVGAVPKEATEKRVVIEDLEPFDGPVDICAVLDALTKFFRDYVVLMKPSYAKTLALWVIVSYCFDCFDICPYVAITSPQKSCGKTLLMDLLAAVAYRQLRASNISVAAIFRTMDLLHPTLLIDEGDTFLNDKELRGVLNAGHRRGGPVIRLVPTKDGDYAPRAFDVFGPKAIGLIGNLPGTLAHRSIHVPMQRRLKNEKVLRLRVERETAAMRELRSQCLRWANDHETELRHADPVLPEALENRQADNWRPLITIADIAGGDWPSVARSLATNEEIVDTSVGIELLEDLRLLFVTNGPRLLSSLIVEKLGEMEHRRWPEFDHGKPITASALARLLRPFGVQPRPLWRPGEEKKPKGDGKRGYDQNDLRPIFDRYLKPLTNGVDATSEAASGNGAAPDSGADDVVV